MENKALTRQEMMEIAAKRIAAACGNLGIYPDALDFYSYPEWFGSTSGPFGGIGGAAITKFQIEAFAYGNYASIFCCGRYLFTTTGFQLGSTHLASVGELQKSRPKYNFNKKEDGK